MVHPPSIDGFLAIPYHFNPIAGAERLNCRIFVVGLCRIPA
jgi:hypothetical protein